MGCVVVGRLTVYAGLILVVLAAHELRAPVHMQPSGSTCKDEMLPFCFCNASDLPCLDVAPPKVLQNCLSLFPLDAQDHPNSTIEGGEHLLPVTLCMVSKISFSFFYVSHYHRFGCSSPAHVKRFLQPPKKRRQRPRAVVQICNDAAVLVSIPHPRNVPRNAAASDVCNAETKASCSREPTIAALAGKEKIPQHIHIERRRCQQHAADRRRGSLTAGCFDPRCSGAAKILVAVAPVEEEFPHQREAVRVETYCPEPRQREGCIAACKE
eukprot:scaffold846_cov252-Pinguiococcus_pyrenoidosus.AAC.16